MMVEHRFYKRLTVVERSFDGERVHIRIRRSRHHPALHVGDAALREKNHDIRLCAAPKSFDGGPAGIPRRRHDNGRAFIPLTQDMIHQPRNQLHRQVLEGECRPVKQLQHEKIRIELGQWRDRGMAKAAIGFPHHAREISFANCVSHKRADHFDRDLGVGPSGKILNGGAIERRPAFRDVKAAVAGKAREHHIDKIEWGSLAPRRDITH
jgi:hypothetical protein